VTCFQNLKLHFVRKVIIGMAVKTDYKRFTRTYSVYNSVYMSIIINVLVAHIMYTIAYTCR
jgi:hypothetical protein